VTQLVLKIAARPKGVAAMLQALAQVMFQAKLERSCLECQVYAETGNPQSLLYIEQWTTEQELEGQLCSPRFGTLLAIMETAPVAPSLQIQTVSDQRGLEYVEAVRSQPGKDDFHN
jgi:quinol monooxygenase YgiN